MKIVAWADRRFERDAQDFGDHEKLFGRRHRDRLYADHGDCSDLLNDENFDYDTASARVLGRDIGRMLTEESRSIMELTVTAEDERERLSAAMVRNNANYHGNSEMALAMLEALRQGLSER